MNVPMAGERILIVDDNATSLKLAAFLMRAHGYEVTVAANAEAALDAIELQHPDLVLMEIQLPGIDGLELERRLRADARRCAPGRARAHRVTST